MFDLKSSLALRSMAACSALALSLRLAQYYFPVVSLRKARTLSVARVGHFLELLRCLMPARSVSVLSPTGLYSSG